MDIQTKDGILLRNIPDGTPDDVIKARIAKIRAEGQPAAPVAEEKGFFDESPLAKVTNPQNWKDMAGGLVRGAGSIGATALLPADMINQKMRGDDFFSLEDNNARRKKIDSGLQLMGANPESGLYQTGKLASEIAGTAGVGDALAAGKAIQQYPRLASALKSGGFSLNGTGKGFIGDNVARAVGGAAVGGASAGMVSPESAGTGTAIGVVAPQALRTAGKVGEGVANTLVKALRGFTPKGQEKIVAENLLANLGDDAPAVIARLEQAKGSTAGFNPTVGQAADNADLATYERAFKSARPDLFQEGHDAQYQALATAARGLGGDDLARQGLVEAREQATNQLYDSAQGAQVQLTPELQQLMQRPSMQSAAKQAQNIAAEQSQGGIIEKAIPEKIINSPILGANGLPMTSQTVDAMPAQMLGKDAQRIKMALDDATNTANVRGIGGNELGAIRDTKTAYLGELEKQIPEYSEANRLYRDLSKPINELDVGNAIADKYIPALYDGVKSPSKLNHEALAKALRDGDKIAQNVTGFKGAKLSETLSPQNMKILEGLVKDSRYIASSDLKGRAVGSNTFQNLTFGKRGAKDGVIDNVAALSAPLSMLKALRDKAYGGVNDDVTMLQAKVMQDPKLAAILMNKSLSEKQKMLKLAQVLKAPTTSALTVSATD